MTAHNRNILAACLPVNTLGERLAYLRQSKGLSLRDVQGSTGVTYAYLSRLETGKISDPGLKPIEKLGNFYAVSFDFIIRGTSHVS